MGTQATALTLSSALEARGERLEDQVSPHPLPARELLPGHCCPALRGGGWGGKPGACLSQAAAACGVQKAASGVPGSLTAGTGLSPPGARPGARTAGTGAQPGGGEVPPGSPAGAERVGSGACTGRGARPAALLSAPGPVTPRDPPRGPYSCCPHPWGPLPAVLTGLPSPFLLGSGVWPQWGGRGWGRTSESAPPRTPAPSISSPLPLWGPRPGFLVWGLPV